jgi:hypothetical protein
MNPTKIRHHNRNMRNRLIKMKALGAAIILSAAVATPVFAQDAGAIGPGNRYGLDSQAVTKYRGAFNQNFRGAYNQSRAPFYVRPLTNEERRNIEDFGFSGRDPSRVGGEDAWLHPGG